MESVLEQVVLLPSSVVVICGSSFIILAPIVSQTQLLLDDNTAIKLSLLDLVVLEVSPLLKDLHSLDILDGCQLLSVVFVAAK